MIIVTVEVVLGLMAFFGVLIVRHIRKRKVRGSTTSSLMAEERDNRKEKKNIMIV